MNVEQMIETKVQLTQLNAVVGFWVFSILMVAAIAMLLSAVKIARRAQSSDAPIPLLIFGGAIVLFSVIGLAIATYDFTTAELQARADLANYGLIELKK